MPVGDAEPFRYVHADGRRQFARPLEEAAELFATWRFRIRRRDNRRYSVKARGKMPDRAADAIQAVVDCVASVGIDDMSGPMGRREKLNTKRGRYRCRSKRS